MRLWKFKSRTRQEQIKFCVEVITASDKGKKFLIHSSQLLLMWVSLTKWDHQIQFFHLELNACVACLSWTSYETSIRTEQTYRPRPHLRNSKVKYKFILYYKRCPWGRLRHSVKLSSDRLLLNLDCLTQNVAT